MNTSMANVDVPSLDNATVSPANQTDCPMVIIPEQIFYTIGLASLVENLLVVVAVIYNKNLHSPMYCFICSLAAFNTIASLSKIWENIMLLFVDMGYLNASGDLERKLDDVMDSLLVMSFIGSMCSFLAIALDRYITIFHALRYHNIMTLRRAGAILSAIWTLCGVAGVLIVLHFDSRVVQISLIVFFPVSLLLILFLYMHMFLLALVHARKIASLQQRRRGMRGALTLTLLFGVFVVCWAPFFLHLLVMMLCPMNQYCECYRSFFQLHIVLLMSHAVIDPAIYAFRSAELRHTFRKMLFGSVSKLCCSFY